MPATSYANSILSLCLIFLSSQAFCHREHQHTQVDAHTHGQADLTLVSEGTHLNIELHSPAVNLLGYESKADTVDKRRILESTKIKLLAARPLFSFHGTSCELIENKADFSSIEIDLKELSDIVNDSRISIPATHLDVSVFYHFQCDSNSQLEKVSTTLISTFPQLISINAQWVQGEKQGIHRLTQNKNTILLTQ